MNLGYIPYDQGIIATDTNCWEDDHGHEHEHDHDL